LEGCNYSHRSNNKDNGNANDRMWQVGNFGACEFKLPGLKGLPATTPGKTQLFSGFSPMIFSAFFFF